MAIRLSGLTSGMDTDAIVQELVSAYNKKTEKYEKAQTKLTWKQDIWKGLNTKIYGLYTNVSNLRYSSAYNLRKTTVSDNTKATVTASSDAVTGTQKLNILQTAQSSYITGGKLETEAKSTTKLSELGYKGGNTSFEVRKEDGTTQEIKVTKESSINDVIGQFKEAGYNASFDEANQRIFISAKESGAKNDFNIYAKSGDANSNNALSLLGLNTALTEKVKVKQEDGTEKEVTRFTSAGAAKYQIPYDLGQAALDDGKSVETYINALAKEYDDLKAAHGAAVANNTLVEKEYETQLAEVNKLQSQLDARNAYNEVSKAIKPYVTSADARKALIDGGITEEEIADLGLAPEQESELKSVIEAQKNNIQAIGEWTSADVYDIPLVDKQKKLSEAKDKLQKFKEDIDNNNNAIAEYEKFCKNNSYIVEKLEACETDEEKAAAVTNLIAEINEANEVYTSPNSATGSASKITGQDAVIRLNGVEFTNSTNSFTVNGLTIHAQSVTGEDDEKAISITTSVDTQGVYDKIKDFLTEYNNVVNELTKYYNAEYAKDYEPLTDEEKEAMSEEQIEKWESKIKDSLLRRDNTLNSILSTMVNSMAQTYEVNGEKLSLSTFGISTLGFLNAAKDEHYAYHIAGDEDDENTSDKEDKLMKAIEEDPEQVMEFMKQLTDGLYKAIDVKMKSTELSSAYKVYNDKEMDKELSNYAQIIKDWEKKVSDKEEYYYDKFAQMEVALSKLQNQTSSISGLLGQ